MDINKKLFVAEMKKQLALKNWTHADLAKEIGFSKSAIDKFTSGQRNSTELANAISVALGMR